MNTGWRFSICLLAVITPTVAIPYSATANAREDAEDNNIAANEEQKPEKTLAPLELPPGYETDVTEADAVAFGRKMQRAFDTSDRRAINRLIDWQRVADRACRRLSRSKAELVGIKARMAEIFSEGCERGSGLVAEILQNSSQGGHYGFVRVTMREGFRHALFRLAMPSGNLNYHDFLLIRNPSGNVVAADIHIQFSAEYVSETLGRLVGNLLPRGSGSGRMTEAEREWASSADTLSAILKATKQRRYSEVVRLCTTLPKTVQRSKYILHKKVLAAQHVGERQYLAAIREYRECYPRDNALAMKRIDYYSRKRDFDKVLKTIEELDADVCDPYLNVLRAKTCYEKKDFPAARKYVDRFVADFPQIRDGYNILAAAALQQRDFSTVTKAVKILHRDFNINPIALTNLPLYSPYKKSNEYEKLTEYVRPQAETSRSTHPNP